MPAAVQSDVDNAHSESGWEFWKHGGRTGDGREVIGIENLVDTVRAAHAAQPVIVMSWKDDRLFEGAGSASLIDDDNII